jgi:hypothetical protein
MSKMTVSGRSKGNSNFPQIRFSVVVRRVIVCTVVTAAVMRIVIITVYSVAYWPLFLIVDMVLALFLGLLSACGFWALYRVLARRRRARFNVIPAIAAALVFCTGWTLYVSTFGRDQRGLLETITVAGGILLAIVMAVIPIRATQDPDGQRSVS